MQNKKIQHDKQDPEQIKSGSMASDVPRGTKDGSFARKVLSRTKTGAMANNVPRGTKKS